jgi:hypothetical protein
MYYQFEWRSPTNQQTREAAETRIKDDLDRCCPFKPCHEGPVLVTVSFADPFDEFIVGNIACKCGNPLGTRRGAIDGSPMTYAAVK